MKTEPTDAIRYIMDNEFGDGIMDIEDAEEAVSIAFREGQSSPKIKQLEWLDDNFPYRGCSIFVDYLISKNPGSYYTVTLDIGTGIRINSFKTLDEAKSAAQADFEQRVMECLE